MRKRNLEQIYKYSPHLRGADPDRLNQTLSDMESLNPRISRTPIVAGTLLSDAMTEDGIHLDKAKGVADLRRDNPYLGLKTDDLDLGFSPKKTKLQKKREAFNQKHSYPAEGFNADIYDTRNKKSRWFKKESSNRSNKFISASNFF